MRRLLIALISAALLTSTACNRGPEWHTALVETETVVPPKIVLLGPTDGSKGVPTSAEIRFTLAGAVQVSVVLVDAGGVQLDGEMRTDTLSWVPANQLRYGQQYTATVIATKSDGTTAEARTTFTTMAQPATVVEAATFIYDDDVLGVALPIVVTFERDIPEKDRAAVQRRLFVRSDPPQEGIWHWIGPSEVHYRTREHWLPGTILEVRLATGGLPLGSDDVVGARDITVRASIGPETTFEVDNKTKRMTVTQRGRVVRTIPVSLGKPSDPTSSGRMVIMSRNPSEVFDSSTYGVPVNSPRGYRTTVQWPMRLTWAGEYIHAAPWSVGDQGRRNVSHGCVNLATDQAKFVYDLAKVGDPVIVTGTERHVAWGNGWTDWDVPWSEYVKGSAIPYEPATTSSPGGS
jgi:lipoprotein-anchoring transpeptidase ErfK/SrfK